MKQWLGTLILLLSISVTGATQEAAENSNGTKDIDPLSLQVLKAATEPIHQAKAFSFRALVSREHLGTNGQIITLFQLSRFTFFPKSPNAKEIELLKQIQSE